MRILICNKYNFEFSGTEVYLFELARLLEAHGHEVAWFSMAHPRNTHSACEHHFVPFADFREPRLKLWKRARLAERAIYYREARRRLALLAKDFRPDVAHVRNIYHHLSPSILWELRARGVPVIYHLNDFKIICPTYNLISHGRICEKCKSGRFWHVFTEGCHNGPLASALTLGAEAYFHKWLGTYRKCVDRFIAPTEFCRNKLIENGWSASKIEVLYHFQRIPAVPYLLPQEDYVLYFGRLAEEKGIRSLLFAMQRLPDIRLLIAGEGPQKGELEALAAMLGLRNVSFAGYRKGEDLYRLIHGARFTVMPSLTYETLGKTILESYALARPVIASDLGPRRELIADGITGLLFHPGSANDLAEKMTYLYKRIKLCAEMGEEGKKTLGERHSPELHYGALLKIYAQVQGGQ